ncbi:retinol dehydrogenase 16-like [Amphiura filiformis]|uniref:retinol dehydrogenase 16-like n=1 Tax=Amphiura filiformis TaxID=82378 RepID=UPI003B2168AB
MFLILALISVGIAILFWLLDRVTLSPKGRYVLITGCDTGFGNALAKSLDRKGCNVFATCLTPNGAKTLEECTSDRLHVIMMDVLKSESIKEAFEEVQKKLPQGTGLWGLVNNAGVTGNVGYYDWWTRDDFRRILEVNLLGVIEVTNVFLPLVKKVKGRIVNMSSGIALAPCSAGGYAISKVGIETYSDCLRLQLHHFQTSVHIIEPSFFQTDGMQRKKAFDDPLERAWSRMSKEQQDAYGRSCIDEFKQLYGEISKTADTRIHLVTDSIEHALFAKYPWKRYPVGGLIRFVARPGGLLPSFIGDFLRYNFVPFPTPHRGQIRREDTNATREQQNVNGTRQGLDCGLETIRRDTKSD